MAFNYQSISENIGGTTHVFAQEGGTWYPFQGTCSEPWSPSGDCVPGLLTVVISSVVVLQTAHKGDFSHPASKQIAQDHIIMHSFRILVAD